MSFIALGPLIVMAYQGYHCARQALIESKEKHLASILESRKSRFENWFSEINADLKFLVISPCFQKDSCKTGMNNDSKLSINTSPLMGCMERIRNYYKSMVVYDRSFKLMQQSNSGTRRGISHLPGEFVKLMKSVNGFAISPVIEEENGNFILYCGYPVRDGKGVNTSYLVVTVDFSLIMDSILKDHTGLGEKARFFLFSNDKKILYSPEDPPEIFDHLATVTKQFTSDHVPSVHEYTDHRGIKVLGMSMMIPSLKMILELELDQKDVFNWLYILKVRAFITGTITLFLVVIIALRRSQKLSQPLRELARVSREIARGKHETRVESLEGTEAKEVAIAFNKMMDEIETSHRKLLHTASLAAVGELSSSIAHEMRNPLSSVKMNLQALKKKVKDDPVYMELADIASQQVERLETMLSDLLNYGKPLTLNTVPLVFKDVVNEVLKILRDEIENKSLEIEVKDDLQETQFFADRELIMRVLTNLINNAIQAVSREGYIVIEGKLDPGAPWTVSISVRDNGHGIMESQIEKVFQPFFTTRDKGTGLGLANVKKIVDYHGGKIEVRNLEEGGTAFTVMLPMKGPAHEHNSNNR